MTKKQRQELILSIIAEWEIDTQEELVKILIDKGCNVTQATASRDIKELELVKVAGKEKKYKYSQVRIASTYGDLSKYVNIFRESVVAIQQAGNLVVVKTVHGGANSAAAFVDNLGMEEILGSIAGDDTIFIATHTDHDAKIVVSKLKSCF